MVSYILILKISNITMKNVIYKLLSPLAFLLLSWASKPSTGAASCSSAACPVACCWPCAWPSQTRHARTTSKLNRNNCNKEATCLRTKLQQGSNVFTDRTATRKQHVHAQNFKKVATCSPTELQQYMNKLHIKSLKWKTIIATWIYFVADY